MFSSFTRDIRGNVAIMFSLIVTTLLFVIGVAIDYTGVTGEKQELQDAVDAATLAAARSESSNPGELKNIAREFLKDIDPVGKKIMLDVQVKDDQVFITANTTYETYLMAFLGKKTMDVKVAAASPIASKTPIKLALVLDTTDSMSGTRIDALKTAANTMLQQFIDDDSPIAVSVVPFGKYVNIGTARKNKNWLDVAKDGTSETEEVCWDERNQTKAQECTPTGRTIYYDDIRDGVNFGQKSYEEQTCTPAEYEYTGNEICEDRTTTYTWHGCVGSRQAPYNEQAAFNNQRISGIMNQTCGTEIQTLTTNLTTAKSMISSLTVSGNTYLPSGVMWGWRSLQEEEPIKTNVDFGTNVSPNAQDAKIMLIMTDGANTKSQGGSEAFRHDGNDAAAANTRTANLCAAAKAEGIQIYTLGFQIDPADTDTITMLQNCATTPSGFYEAGNASALKDAFKDIASRFDFTRLSI